VLALVAASAMFTTLGPLALKFVVDDFTGRGRPDFATLALLISAYIISQWLARAAGEVRLLLYQRIQQRMFNTLTERLFAHLMHLPLRFHLDRRTGAISEAVTTGLEGIQRILSQLVVTVLPVVAELASTVLILAHVAPTAFLMLFCGATIFYSGSFAYSAGGLSRSARTISAARMDAGAAVTDGLLNYETVKYFTAESAIQERVSKALSRCEVEWSTFSRRYACSGLLVASVFVIFLGSTIWYATLAVLHNQMTIGAFVLVNTYMLQFARPVEMLGNAMQSVSQGLAMVETILHFLREHPESSPSQSVPPPDHGTLEFKKVGVCYGKDRPVLREVSFEIPPNRTLAIVGPSGSGKSTIVRLLMRLLEPDEGQILLDGVPVCRISLPQLRRRIAVVPQDTMLFNDSLAYNIALGRMGATLAEVQQAARMACLHDFVTTLPCGYDTCVGERGIKLSGGERQRVSVARAVLKSPSLYVFDEATSSLDSRTENSILVNLRKISQRSSALIIAHRLSTVVHADEILFLEGGRIVERGTHVALLRQNRRYAAMWRIQQRGVAA